MSRVSNEGWVEFFSELSDAGHTTLTRLDIKGLAVEAGLSGSSAYAFARKNFAKVERGIFDITAKVTKTAKPKPRPVTSGVATETVAMAAPSNVVSITEVAQSKVLKRHTLEASNEILIPKKVSTYVPNGAYKVVLKVLSSRRFAPVYITGDTGNGKTLGVEQACAKAKRKLVMFNVTNETCAEDLIGSETLIDGNLVWEDGPVLRAMREGAVLLLDELDQGTHRVLCLQTVLQGKPYYVKKTGETVFPADGFTVVATGNTKGLGDPTGRFGGAQMLNEAFLERFNIMVEQPYPKKSVETKILKHQLDDVDFIDKLTTWAQASRRAFEDGILDCKITTRRLVQIAENFMIFGDRLEAIAYAVERFMDSERKTLLDMYTKIDANVDINDLLSEFDEEDEGEAVSVSDIMSMT